MEKRNFQSKHPDTGKEFFKQSGNNQFVFLSIKHLQSNFECFSDWTKQEMAKFWNFNKRLHQMTWNDIYETGGKKDKTGLAYTIIPKEKYRSIPFISALNDVTLFELRIDEKLRVHGYRSNSIFYMCLLDREHKICK
ncbi:hypothetical protein Barb6_00100 [Bacteroidales bacterium Barb6]|nr:hypothetical protein Barb6_00100 [Bacteroidales bacterium Barb6]